MKFTIDVKDRTEGEKVELIRKFKKSMKKYPASTEITHYLKPYIPLTVHPYPPEETQERKTNMMNPKWIIQKNIYTEDIDEMVKVIRRLDFEYKLIDVTPFSEELPLMDPYDGPIIAYGSTTLMRLAPKEWYPGVWYDKETFKPSVWGEKIGDKYLNSSAEIMPLSEVLDNWKYRKQFVRPNSDFKLFSGAVFMNGDFSDWYKRLTKAISTGTFVNITLETEVSVAEAITIEKEWRFFVADTAVFAGSQYRKDGKLNISNDIELGALELAQEIASDEWQLAPAYVVDVAKTDNGYEVIEFNNFNSSGFYKSNIESIIWGASILAIKQYDQRKKTNKRFNIKEILKDPIKKAELVANAIRTARFFK